MEAHLRAGVAIYNAGNYHAAHDAWEDHWLDLDSGTDDERFLHGLIQFTAAVHHADGGNRSGARGLAESALAYLAGLPADYRGVDLGAVRDALAALEADPTLSGDPPPLRYGGEALALADLDFPATCVAARVLAAEAGYDEDAVEAAVGYAREEVESTGGGTFTALLFDLVRDADRRDLVAQRLVEHVRRRRHREDDVSGLFD
jgi:hypothetical protein